jgi:hypothetical protein
MADRRDDHLIIVLWILIPVDDADVMRVVESVG